MVEKSDIMALIRIIALSATGSTTEAEKAVEWAYNGQEKPKRTKSPDIAKQKAAEAALNEAVERVYSLYPATVIRPDGNRASLKSSKDKQRISRIIEIRGEENLTDIIKKYLAENNGAYIKMLSTLLNNLPDYEGDKELRPQKGASGGDELFSAPGMAEYLEGRRQLYNEPK